jgi:hypothetical protein
MRSGIHISHAYTARYSAGLAHARVQQRGAPVLGTAMLPIKKTRKNTHLVLIALPPLLQVFD